MKQSVQCNACARSTWGTDGELCAKPECEGVMKAIRDGKENVEEAKEKK